MATWQDYLKLMEGLGRTLEQLTQVELEQVLSLSLRGCDQKRDAMLAQLGLHGVSLSQLEDRSPPELQLETKRVVEELRRQYALFQNASQVARDTLEINLRAIERMQAVQAGDAAEAAEQRRDHQTDFRA